MKILVYGAGAIGQFVGGMLAHGGAQVHLIGRPALVSALGSAPLRIQDLDGSEHAVGLTASATVAEALAVPELVILTVKGPATAEAAADLAF